MIFPFPRMRATIGDKTGFVLFRYSKRCVRGERNVKSDLASTFDVRHEQRERQREREPPPTSAHYSPAVSRCQVQFVRLVEARRNDELRDGWDRRGEKEEREKHWTLDTASSDSFLERVDRVPCIGTQLRVVFIIQFPEAEKTKDRERRWFYVDRLYGM